MAERKIPIYLNRDTFENIAVLDDEYPNLNSIFKDSAYLCLDLTDEELNEILEDTESDISLFIRDNDVEIFALHNFFEFLKEDQSLILEKSRSIFLLDISEEEADQLTNNYGVLVRSSRNLDDGFLNFNFNKKLVKEEIYAGKSENGWKNLFSKVSFFKGNSLIITDNFLLSNEEKGKCVGYENIKLLLDYLMPEKLKVPFHVFIICTKPNWSSEKIKIMYEKLKDYILDIRKDYEIKLEVYLSKSMHPRKIISNYYNITCDWGFKVFSPNTPTKIYNNNELKSSSILNNHKYELGDTELYFSNSDIDLIKEICDDVREKVDQGVDGYYIFSNCNESKKIINRLIN